MPESVKTFLLLETAAGYVLLLIKEWDTMAQNLQIAQQSFLEYSKFVDVVEVKAVYLFPNAEIALTTCNAIVSGESDETLRNFLFQNLPQKKSLYRLGCLDPALGKDLSQHGIPILYDKNILEITRLCRYHLRKLIQKFKGNDLTKFQVGLGHSLLRTKLKSDINRQDKPVQNAILILENIDKTLNTFAMRIREWYGWHFPELIKIVTDNVKYAEVIHIMGNRENFTKDRLGELTEIVGDESIAEEILAAKNISMGQDLTDMDMMHIKNFTSQVVQLAQQRKNLAEYLTNKLANVAPNLQALLGNVLAAKLIAHSGSLSNLAKYPASTVQILGAEKALFRALKTKGKTPKYGLLFQSTFIGRSAVKNKGRISRYLANKCSLAARIDNFSPIMTNIFGEKMKEQVEARMKFLTEGVQTQKNLVSMKEANDLYMAQISQLESKSKPMDDQEIDQKPLKIKKKSSKRNRDNVDADSSGEVETEKKKRRKEKKLNKDETSVKKSKKKKS